MMQKSGIFVLYKTATNDGATVTYYMKQAQFRSSIADVTTDDLKYAVQLDKGAAFAQAIKHGEWSVAELVSDGKGVRIEA